MNPTRNSRAKTFCILHSAFCIAATAAYAAAPVIDASSVTVAQRPDRTVEIDYTMTPAAVGDADTAIVTVDILTNAVSVGGEHLRTLTGDVNKRVAHTADYKHKILWEPTKEGMGEISLPAAQVKAEITVWTTNNPPAYWIIDLTHPSDRTYDRYYPEVGQIPLGVTNVLYKTDRLVFRRIPAKGVTWKQGAGEGDLGFRVYRYVTFSYDYYMAIYELTGAQYNYLKPSSWSGSSGMLPYVQNLANMRSDSVDTDWPANGHETISGNGIIKNGIRPKTGLKFDLPTAAEWEFACRAGSSTKYCNGDTEADLAKVAWYYGSDGTIHEVGTKDPNAWGLYDMHGNRWEWALTRHAYRSNAPVWDPLGLTRAETQNSDKTVVGYTDWLASWCLMGGHANDAKYGVAAQCASYSYREYTRTGENTGACRLTIPIP